MKGRYNKCSPNEHENSRKTRVAPKCQVKQKISPNDSFQLQKTQPQFAQNPNDFSNVLQNDQVCECLSQDDDYFDISADINMEYNKRNRPIRRKISNDKGQPSPLYAPLNFAKPLKNNQKAQKSLPNITNENHISQNKKLTHHDILMSKDISELLEFYSILIKQYEIETKNYEVLSKKQMNVLSSIIKFQTSIHKMQK